MISSCVTDLAPCRNEVPMQSEPVSPPPMTMTCLSVRQDVLGVGDGRRRLAGNAAVLLRQEIHGVVDAVEIAPGRLGEEVERLLRAAGEQQRVVAVLELLGRDRLADVRIAMEGDAFRFHLLDAPVDDPLLHLEVGDAVAQQAAGLGVLLVDVHIMTGARELLGGGETGRAGADDGDRACRSSSPAARARPSLPRSARSAMAHSIVLMVTGTSSMLSVHAASHGAGQTRPVTSGKLLVE